MSSASIAHEAPDAPLAELVTFVILSQDGEQDLPPTLEGLRKLGTGCRVIMIDDGSTDGSREMVRSRFQEVEVVELGPSDGRIGRARRRAVEECRTPYLMLMDNDVTFAPGCIERLVWRLREHPRALSCRPRLLYADRPGVIYQDVNTLHFLAVTANQRRGRPADEARSPLPRETIGGGIMLLSCAIARELGNFDENYLFGWSDLELDIRARLRGFATLHDSDALAYHVARPGGLRRVVGQLYNRRRLIAISYSTRSLVVLAPALLLFELVVLAMCLASGYAGQYVHAWRLLKTDAADIRARRREVQGARVHPRDDVFLDGGRISITGRMAESRWLKWLAPALSGSFAVYWRLAAPLVRGRKPR